MDRAYLDFERLYLLNQCMAFFVIRSKSNTRFRRLYSHPIDKSTGLRRDQTILLNGVQTKKQYPINFAESNFSMIKETEVFLSYQITFLSQLWLWHNFIDADGK